MLNARKELTKESVPRKINPLSAKPSFQLWYPGGQRLKVISFSWSGAKSLSKCFSNTEPTTIIPSRDEKRCNASVQSVRADAAKKSSGTCDSGAARQIWKACQNFPRFDFFRLSQASGTSWIFSNKNIANRLTTFLLYSSNPISSCVGPWTWLHGMKSPVLSVFLSIGRRRCGKEAWTDNLRIGNIRTGQGRGAFKLCVHAVDM